MGAEDGEVDTPLEREAEVPAESKWPWRRESSTEKAPRDQGPQEETKGHRKRNRTGVS